MKAKNIIISMLVVGLCSSYAFAATGGTSTSTDAKSTTNLTVTSSDIKANTGSTSTTTDTAASNTPATAVTGTGEISFSVGDYKEVLCSESHFTENSCGQCFDGGKKSVGEKLTNLTDSWTNPSQENEQVIYKEEQTMPELINLGGNGTKWVTNPDNSLKFWKYSDDIIWTESTAAAGKQEFLLDAKKKAGFLESDLGASYTLDSTDKKEGDAVGLLKFAINYHNIDNNGNDSAKKIHTECVAFYSSAVAAKATTTPEPPKAKEVTKVKTGPTETFILILLSLLIAFIILRFKRKA